jgi:hypothetical protein
MCTSKITRPCTYSLKSSTSLICAGKRKVIFQRRKKNDWKWILRFGSGSRFCRNFWIQISESRRSPMGQYQCDRLWPTEPALPQWEILSEDSSVRTPQWGLLSEDSSVRTPQWGLLSEDSSVRTPQWGLLSEDSSVESSMRRVYEGTWKREVSQMCECARIQHCGQLWTPTVVRNVHCRVMGG